MAENTFEKTNTRRLELGTKHPIGYYYSVGQTAGGDLAYVDLQQFLNDKFSGRISQSQYFAIAEQTKRIFSLNAMMIDRVVQEKNLAKDARFMVQISAQWFSNASKIKLLKEMVESLGKGVILCFDAVSLVNAGPEAKAVLDEFAVEYEFEVLLDNIEYLSFVQFMGYSANYIRFDSRFLDMSDPNSEIAFGFLKNYTTANGMKLVVKNIKNEEEKDYYVSLGADIVEGFGVYTPKKRITRIMKDYKVDSLAVNDDADGDDDDFETEDDYKVEYQVNQAKVTAEEE